MRRTLTALATAACGVAASGLLGITPAAAGGGCGIDVTFKTGVTTIGADHACWAPMVAQVAVGQTLTFVNKSGLEHNLTGPGPIGFEDFGLGRTVRITFPTTGIFPYACTFHPGMSGAIVVGDPLGAAARGTPPSAEVTPAVSLSTVDEVGGESLLGSMPRVVGAGAAVAGAAGMAGFVIVRRRRAVLPTG